MWDAHFVHPIREAVITPDDAHRSMEAVATAIQFKYNDDACQRVIYSESHDEVANGKARVPQEINPGDPTGWFAQKRSTLAAALVFTAPGIPMLFQGQEFLAAGAFNDTEPLDWAEADRHVSLGRLYRDLIGLRRNVGGHTRGLGGQHTRVFHVNEADKLVAFARQFADGGPGDTTLVLANFANQTHPAYTIGLPGPGRWLVRFNSDWRGYDGEFGDFESLSLEAEAGEYDGFGWHGSIGVAPYAVLILSQED